MAEIAGKELVEKKEWSSLAIRAIPLLLILVSFAFYLYRLSVPPQYIYDEVYHAYTAAQYASGNTDAYLWYKRAPREGVAYEWTHPPLGKLLIADSILIFGDNSFGWRFASAVFGAIGIGVAYWLGYSLTGYMVVGLLTSFLLLFDGMYYVQSRTGMVDIFLVVFLMLALLMAYKYLTATNGRTRYLLLTGVFIGLAVSTKWNAVYVYAFLGLSLVVCSAYTLYKSRAPVSKWLLEAGLLFAFMLLVPAVLYLLSYTQFFLSGNGIKDFFKLQYQMYYYHSHLKATHNYQSKWWEWPLTLRPVWYYVKYYPDGRIANIYTNGNPVIYLALIPAVLWAASDWIDENWKALLIVVLGFFGAWLPWALIPRIAFAYHFLPSVPFGCVALAYTIRQFLSRGGTWRTAAICYCVAVVAMFVFLFPIYSAIPLTRAQFDMRILIPSWR